MQDFCVSGKGEENLRETYHNEKMLPSDIFQFAMRKYEQGKEETGRKPEDTQNTKYVTKKTCLADCKRTVEKVLAVRLKKDFEEDFYFIIGRAFDELEQIRGLVLDKQRFLFYKSVMSGAHFEPQEQDLADLREAREKMRAQATD